MNSLELQLARSFLNKKNAGGKEQSRIHLDHDVVRSYGPETLTVEGFLEGEYFVRVKHYRGWDCVDKRTNFDKVYFDSLIATLIVVVVVCSK